MCHRRLSYATLTAVVGLLSACAGELEVPFTPERELLADAQGGGDSDARTPEPDEDVESDAGTTPDSGDEIGPDDDTTAAPDTFDDADAGTDADSDDVAEPDIDDDTSPEPDTIDAGPEDTDVPDTDPGPLPELTTVAHDREFRGIWVATVSNINFPSRTGLSVAQLRTEIRAMVDLSRRVGLNAIVFQVRPEGDALYDSRVEPWSRYLTGTQGRDPGLDPLAELIAYAHEQGVEVHAWMNPYRARATASSTAVSPNMAIDYPQYAYRYGSGTWMDPGAAPVQQRLLDVVEDLVTRYDLDGIHFDDYFYPYPDGEFPDSATWNAYRASGGTLNIGDWRRDNVNRMMEQVHQLVLDLDPDVRFGIAPFGIYRPGIPPGITGLDQYAAIYADPVRWMEEGWVDYLAPQLYWPTTQTAQAYEVLLDWWVTVNPLLYIFAGNYLSKLGDSSAWTIAEFREQLRLSRAYRAENSMGNIWFQIGPLENNESGIADIFRTEFYARPALTPELASALGESIEPPRITSSTSEVTITHDDAAALRAYTVYRDAGGGAWQLDRIIPASSGGAVSLPAGRWAIAAVDRRGIESQGVVLER
ncbi:MAG: family 10 glycosylhydrolase [Myxococcales bacterium]|nr:family 10 glycosylhydrolase [Myxococcales bacterium]